MAPWWWFPCKPKHVGAVLLILECFSNSTFFNFVCVSWILKCWILLMYGVTMKFKRNRKLNMWTKLRLTQCSVGRYIYYACIMLPLCLNGIPVQTVSAVWYSSTFNGSLATTVVLNLPCCLFTFYERNLRNLEHFPKSYHTYFHDPTL